MLPGWSFCVASWDVESRWLRVRGWWRNSCIWTGDDKHDQKLDGHAAGCPRAEGQGTCISDETGILARVQIGDEAACEALVRQHCGRMLAVARRFFRTEEDSADAVQDAFLAAFRSLDSFEGNSTLGTWLHRVVVNACLMKLRAQSRAGRSRSTTCSRPSTNPGTIVTRSGGGRIKRWRGSARPKLGLTYGRASTGCPILTERFCSSATSSSLTPNKRRRQLGIAQERLRRVCTAPARRSGPCLILLCWNHEKWLTLRRASQRFAPSARPVGLDLRNPFIGPNRANAPRF